MSESAVSKALNGGGWGAPASEKNMVTMEFRGMARTTAVWRRRRLEQDGAARRRGSVSTTSKEAGGSASANGRGDQDGGGNARAFN